MPFSTLSMCPAETEEYVQDAWKLSVDGRQITSTTMALDHAVDPLVVNHCTSDHVRCSSVSLVSARRVGDVVVWLAPAAVRSWHESEPRVLWTVESEPLVFTGEAYARGIATLVADPAAAIAALPPLDLPESQELLWIAARRCLEPWPPWDASERWWEPAWPAFLAERTWATTDPRDPALEDRLATASERIASARVVELIAERPAGCVLFEGFMDRPGEPCIERLVATQAPGRSDPDLWHPVGRGCWGRLDLGS